MTRPITAFVNQGGSVLLKRSRQCKRVIESFSPSHEKEIIPSTTMTALTATPTSLGDIGVHGGDNGGVTYEAVMPPTETLLGMGLILVLCVAAFWVWDKQVVPVSRTKLALSKSRGDVKEYLDELKASNPRLSSSSNNNDDDDDVTARAVATMSGNNHQINEENERHNETTQAVDDVDTANMRTAKRDDRALERWLFSDWLTDNKSDPSNRKSQGRQKEAALPILKDAKWNSGDNPVVVAAALMILGLVFTAASERMIVPVTPIG